MSIVSSVYAEFANKVRLGWLKLLDEAIAAKDWTKVKELREVIARYEFDE